MTSSHRHGTGKVSLAGDEWLDEVFERALHLLNH